MAIRRIEGTARRQHAEGRLLAQHDVDIKRLWRQQQTDLAPLAGLGASGLGGNGVLGGGWFELTAPLYRATAAAANRLLWDGMQYSYADDQVVLFGDFIRGYFFIRDQVRAEVDRRNNRLYAVGSGATYVTGVLTGTLADNGSQSLLVDGGNGQTLDVFGKYGGADVATAIGCLWNERLQRWDAALEKCGT